MPRKNKHGQMPLCTYTQYKEAHTALLGETSQLTVTNIYKIRYFEGTPQVKAAPL